MFSQRRKMLRTPSRAALFKKKFKISSFDEKAHRTARKGSLKYFSSAQKKELFVCIELSIVYIYNIVQRQAKRQKAFF